MLPTSLLLDKFNVVRKSNDAISCGISPESSLKNRSRALKACLVAKLTLGQAS